jgi:hypothetical protein
LAGSYRKKPVVIEAVQYTGLNAAEVLFWVGASQDEPGPRKAYLTDAGEFIIPTLEGDHRADAGDWIIRGVKGEHYPCKPDIFAATYEPAAKPAPGSNTPAGDSVFAEIAAERRRQVEVEGWSPEHDDKHRDGSLAQAAGCYVFHAAAYQRVRYNIDLAAYRASPPRDRFLSGFNLSWPWDRAWWKPKDPRRDLIRAGALIVAEVERLDRAAAAEGRTNG